MKRKKIIIIGIIIILIILSFLIYKQYYTTGKAVNNANVKIVPLTAEQREKVAENLLESEFIKDIPGKGAVALVFYNFENGERVWNDGFLIGRNQLLSQGNPDFQIMIHQKYISELNDNNICEVVQKAKSNGDLAFYSETNKALLLIKYAGMLKYRSCFGF